MTITYSDGRTISAVILSEKGETLRVALQGNGDAVTFTRHHNVWIGEDCEPVRLEYAWQRPSNREVVTEADCICSKELAAHLLHLFFSGDEETALPLAAPVADRTCLRGLRSAERN